MTSNFCLTLGSILTDTSVVLNNLSVCLSICPSFRPSVCPSIFTYIYLLYTYIYIYWTHLVTHSSVLHTTYSGLSEGQYSILLSSQCSSKVLWYPLGQVPLLPSFTDLMSVSLREHLRSKHNRSAAEECLFCLPSDAVFPSWTWRSDCRSRIQSGPARVISGGWNYCCFV